MTDTEIRVGDEVTCEGYAGTMVVTHVSFDASEDGTVSIVHSRGGVSEESLLDVKKTGRHFPEMVSLLGQLKQYE
jgi:hypothetical protein